MCIPSKTTLVEERQNVSGAEGLCEGLVIQPGFIRA